MRFSRSLPVSSISGQLQKKTGLATENIIGVVFAASLGIGAAITPSEDLVDALFGKVQNLSLTALVFGVAAIGEGWPLAATRLP